MMIGALAKFREILAGWKVGLAGTTWNDELDEYADDTLVPAQLPPRPVIISAPFLKAYGGRIWQPNDIDRKCAALFHLELNSRISTQEIGYSSGVETSALESLRVLFERARIICADHATALHFETIVWFVLNHHVRPFTSRWHRRSTEGGLRALDDTDEFRVQLAELRGRLRRLDDLLLSMRGGPRSIGMERSEAEAVALEMSKALPWGLDRGDPKRLDGVQGATPSMMASDEADAIAKRRKHYGLENVAWASGLALSGGGIRSATFALGVLSVFARRGLLPKFDYLSTVSGGGYLGAFLMNFLTSEDAKSSTSSPLFGLRQGQRPFETASRDSTAIGSIRQQSRYLASGPFHEKWSMAVAQASGLLINLLALAALATVPTLVWLGLSRILPCSAATWLASIPRSTLIAGSALPLAVMVLISPATVWFANPRSRNPDRAMATCAAIFGAALLLLICRVILDFYVIAVTSYPALIVAILTAPLGVLLIGVALERTLPRGRMIARWIARAAAPILIAAAVLTFAFVLRQYPRSQVALSVAVTSLVSYFWLLLDLNQTGLHRHYRRKLAEAFLIAEGTSPGSVRPDVERLLSELRENPRGPYPIINAALNVPRSEKPAMRGRLTDFFSFTPHYCGSPITGYFPTTEWEAADPELNLAAAMAISGAAISPQMGLQNRPQLSFWLSLLNIRLGYWLRHPRKWKIFRVLPPALCYLIRELTGKIDENSNFLNLSDGGHIENLGVYELLQRRCKFIVVVDGEQDQRMTFHAIANLQRLASIDLGIVIDIDLDALRLDADGLSRSHFQFSRIHYSDTETGYLVYLKLSLTGNEGEFLKRFKLDEPDFPHHPTADQNFTEARFEAYRSLGQHVGEKLFLKSIVGEVAKSKDVGIEDWFCALGHSFLDPAPFGPSENG